MTVTAVHKDPEALTMTLTAEFAATAAWPLPETASRLRTSLVVAATERLRARSTAGPTIAPLHAPGGRTTPACRLPAADAHWPTRNSLEGWCSAWV